MLTIKAEVSDKVDTSGHLLPEQTKEIMKAANISISTCIPLIHILILMFE